MTDTLHQKLVQARRDQILDAAQKVFSQNGFHATTIKDIANEASIADGTIYNYFKNKTALLLAIFERMRDLIQPQADQIAPLLDGDLHHFLSVFIQLPLNALRDDDFQLFKIIVSEMMTNDDLRDLYYREILEPTLTVAEHYLQEWALREGKNDLDIPLIVRSLSSLMMGLMIQNVMGDETLKSRWDDLPHYLATLILSGLESKT